MMENRRLGIGEKAPDFNLPGVDGKLYSLDSFKDKKIIVVIFTCNHCPYVQAYESRFISIQKDTLDKSVALVAINANETKNYPEDTFLKMVERAREKNFNFPYLRDEDQSVAKAFGAHYTPEIFLLDEERHLRYTGRIDDNWKNSQEVKTHDLRDTINKVFSGEKITTPETPATGCTIKWAQ